jgi:hypothetical protein
MLNETLIKRLVEAEVQKGLLLRFKASSLAAEVYVKYNEQRGQVELMFPLPSKAIGGLSSSIRGCDYIHEWLNRLEVQNPNFCKYLRG